MSLLAVLTVLALAGDATAPPTLRLPGGVRPLREAVDLTLDPARETFSGSVEIDLELREPLPVLWLNAVGLKVSDASIRRDGKASPLRVVPGGEDFVGFAATSRSSPARPSCRSDSRAGCLAATTRASSPCRRRDAWYLFSQFEAISGAPRLPVLRRARLQDPLGRHAARAARRRGALQLPGRVVARRGHETGPRLRADAAAAELPGRLRVGPFELVPRRRPRAASTCPRGSSCRSGRGADTAWARESTPRILGLLEDYFDRPYPYEKLDQVAIPGRGLRDGEPRPRDLRPDPDGPARRRRDDLVAPRLGERRRARARPPVVRRPGDDGLVGRHLAQRVVRELDRREGHRPLPARLGSRDRPRLQPLGRPRRGQRPPARAASGSRSRRRTTSPTPSTA